jgi:hypothetical protein
MLKLRCCGMLSIAHVRIQRRGARHNVVTCLSVVRDLALSRVGLPISPCVLLEIIVCTRSFALLYQLAALDLSWPVVFEMTIWSYADTSCRESVVHSDPSTLCLVRSCRLGKCRNRRVQSQSKTMMAHFGCTCDALRWASAAAECFATILITLPRF